MAANYFLVAMRAYTRHNYINEFISLTEVYIIC